ncbi:DUF6585 family protein [Streptomyces sp. NPDC050516]|uniref:DUF6585 family protein n=1 Tax=Streptomyces sp. NPDC050516 TaxID=3365621 RepID=UPI0037978914
MSGDSAPYQGHLDRDGVVQQVGAAAAREGLGAHRAAYPSIAQAQRQHVKRVQIAAAVLAVLVVICLATGYVPLAFVVGLPLLMCLYAIMKYSSAANRNEGSRLDLFEHGLTSVHRGAVRVVRYADTTVLQNNVRHTQYGQTTRISYAYTVTDTTGTQVTLREGYAQPHEWGPAIQQAVTQAQLPQAVAELNAGRRLEFGPLWLTPTEIGSGDKSTPWPQVEEVAVKDGYVRIRVAGRWSALSMTAVSRIPNFLVFHALADHLRRGPASSG